MAKIIVSIEFDVDIDDLDSAYSNEDYLAEDIREHLSYALHRFDAQNISFNRVDIEGL